MQNEYGFFSSQNDRKYSAEDFCKIFSDFFTNGILLKNEDNFLVTAGSDLSVNVATGTAYINGHFFRPASSSNILVNSNYTENPRYTLIVIRLDYISRMIYLETIDGTSAQAPEYPELIRNENVYDLCLAAVLVGPNQSTILQTDIIDTRGETSYCGYVTGTVNELSNTDVFEHFNAEWEILKSAINEDSNGTLETWAELGNVRTVNGVSPDENYDISLPIGNVFCGANGTKYLVQTGVFVSEENNGTITFPIAYKTIPAVFVTPDYGDNHRNTNYLTISTSCNVTKTSFKTYKDDNIQMKNNWLAIGEID